MNSKDFIHMIISSILFIGVLFLLNFISGFGELNKNELKEVSKTFIKLCENNGGLLLEENFFGEITKSKCYYNNESFSFWFYGEELRLKNKILINNFNKNGK